MTQAKTSMNGRTARALAVVALMLTLALVVANYSRNHPRSSGENRDGGPLLATMTDDQKLLLLEQIPIGATPTDVIKVVPELGDRRPEGRGLTDALAEVRVLGYGTRVEFNFASDSLYGVYFGPLELASAIGDSLFDRLTNFYTQRLGVPQVEDAQDSPYFVKSRNWRTRSAEIGVTNSLVGDKRELSWGYQRVVVRQAAP